MKGFTTRDTPYLIHHLFDGEMYVLTDVRSIGSGATVFIQGKTGDRIFHTIERSHAFEGGGPFTIEIIEEPTITDGTSVLTPQLMNRTVSLTPAVTFFSDPTAISGGTIIDQLFMPSGGVGSQKIGAGSVGIERMLKKNTDYVMKIINAGGASTFYTEILFYETGN